ncbi:uncharacterized protein [Haliotis cracherodii]|uniref:uncharacterized protein n=1 Tax=Haliotis cracherodii TaxID=6455 RepID=UPI0039EAE4A6
MCSRERMVHTGEERILPDVPAGKDEVALALEEAQRHTQETPHPTENVRNVASSVQDEQLCTSMTKGASGGYMLGSNVAGAHHGDNYILYFPNADVPFKQIKDLIDQMKTSVSSTRTAQNQPCQTPMTDKGNDNADEHITSGVSYAEHEEEHLMTDEELYFHLHQCHIDVSDEDINALKDDEVYCYIVDFLACYNIRRSGPRCDSTALGVKMRNTVIHHTRNKIDPPNAATEETTSDVKLKFNVKGGKDSGKQGKDLLDDVDSEHLMEDCTIAPTQLHGLNDIPGRCVEFTYDLRWIQSRAVRVITRHNVEKTVEIGKLLSLEKVRNVFSFLDAILTEFDQHWTTRGSGFYPLHPESISEIIRIDLRDIQNILVRVKTKQNVELILQISAMKPSKIKIQKIEHFLSGMLLEEY